MGAYVVVGGLGVDERGAGPVGDVTRFTDERADLVVGGSEAAARFGEADEFPAEEDRCATRAASAHSSVGMGRCEVGVACGERGLAER